MKSNTSWSDNAADLPMIALVIFLFFARGFSTVLVDTLIPKLKSLFELSYTQAMLTQFCFYFGYLIFSVPAAHILARTGYIRAIVLGLFIMMTGCLMFLPAALLGLYPGYLAALFVIAAGITTLQVVTNPLIVLLGQPNSSHSRLTLAQAFNSLGTTIAPLVGAWLILGSAMQPALSRANVASGAVHHLNAHVLQLPFLAIAGVLSIVAVIFWLNRKRPIPKVEMRRPKLLFGFRLLRNRKFSLGVMSIFVYVGAEVSIGSIIITYLMQTSVLSVAAPRAGELASLYWGGAMCGRFIGSATLRKITPGSALSCCAIVAAVLAILSSCSTGATAAGTIVAIGLFNSIMFPTIFSLALEGLGDHKPEGSGMLCMAIVGGAIMPIITGMVADRHGLAFSLLVPAVCYVWIAFYGIYMGRSAGRRSFA
jgi:FHS family L-fucose permease-like MFS transporter